MNLSSTRQTIHDALSWGYLQIASNGLQEYLIYLTRIEKSIVNRDPVDCLEAAYICAAINTIRPHLGGWLKYAYGPDDSGLVQTALASKLRFELFPIASVKKNARLFELANTGLEDYRLRVRRYRELPIQVYAQRLGVHPEHWARDWSDKQDKCLDAIKLWDAEGVGQVSRMVKALRGENDDETPSVVLKELENGGD